MALLRYRSRIIACFGTLCLCLMIHLPSHAQLPIQLPSGQSAADPTSSKQPPLNFSVLTNPLVSDWIWLDGRRFFQIAATENNLSERTQTVQDNLDRIQYEYLKSNAIEPSVSIDSLNNLPVIYVNNEYLLTVTALDADLRKTESLALANEIKSILETGLKKARNERRPQYLRQQGQIAAGVVVIILLCNAILYLWQRSLYRPTKVMPVSTVDATSKLPPARFLGGLLSLLRQVLSIVQVSIWFLGLLVCLDRFPYTRPIKNWTLRSLSVPLTIALVGLCTYLMIRFSWALVNRFALALTVSPLLTPIVSRRMQLRISTIANVIKGFALPFWGSIGVIVALALLKVDVGPLLAGVGLLGVAISLASQSIIKDAINGFLVILEDQFGVGDVIQVGDHAGAVETLNLRITQIRNAEGQLITIPNSEIRIVANLSSEWSRVDLNIPIPYNTDVDRMLDLIQATAVAMAEDPDWKSHIIESPQLMGIDDFDNRGLIAKVWIKTQPLQQWAVSRELRRRLKLAFDQADIAIPVSQHSLWVNQHHV